MKFLLEIRNLFKRFLGYPDILQDKQCQGKTKLGASVYFCTKNSGHFGPHETYRGRLFL